jgi:hypothetical protein
MTEKFVNFSLEVVAPPGWFLSLAPLALRVVKGDPATFTVTATAKGGYVSDLALSILGLPAGVSAVITPSTIPQNGTAVVTIPTADIPEDSKLDLQLKGVGA